MKLELYKEIVVEIQKIKTRDALPILKLRFPRISERTLGSILSQEYQRKTKRSHSKHHVPERMAFYYERYQKMLEMSRVPGCLLKIADEFDLSPSLMARIIMEQYLTQHTGTAPTRQTVSRLMKNSTLIEDPRLSADVYLCALHDDNYGSIADVIGHSIGHQYEFKLKRHLEAMKIPFMDEEKLRLQGYDKTPDVKLEIPIAVNGHVVNWIESKASFGDTENHKTYLKEQFWSYWNRFGPGLVIYWFGFIDDLNVYGDKGILLCDCFPLDITVMDPNSIPDEF